MGARSRLILMLVGGIACSGILPGCGRNSEEFKPLVPLVTPVSHLPDQQPSNDPAFAATELQYLPPYPNRVDPFSFPVGTSDAGAERNVPHANVAVDVLGFADVDDPRVFLRLDGRTHSLAEGSRVGGIEVVKIKPPVVELRRGTLVWTATMFGVSRHANP